MKHALLQSVCWVSISLGTISSLKRPVYLFRYPKSLLNELTKNHSIFVQFELRDSFQAQCYYNLVTVEPNLPNMLCKKPDLQHV